jgi:hypothetical protein
VIYCQLKKNLVWAKLRDYAISLANQKFLARLMVRQYLTVPARVRVS